MRTPLLALCWLLVALSCPAAIRDNPFTTNRVSGVPANGHVGVWNAVTKVWDFQEGTGGGQVGTNATLVWRNTNALTGQWEINNDSNVLQITYIDDFGVETPMSRYTSNGLMIIPYDLSILRPLTVNSNVTQLLFLLSATSNALLQTASDLSVTSAPVGIPGQVVTYTTIGPRYSNEIALTRATFTGGASNLTFNTEITASSNMYVRQGINLGPGGTLATNFLYASSALDFPQTGAQTETNLPITLSGVLPTDFASVSWTNNLAGGTFTWFCSNGAVFVRFHNYSASAIDPPSSVFKVWVTQFR